MAIRTLAQRNALAQAYGAAAPYVCLFTADPGTSGTATGEVTGGAPPYARVAAAWAAPSNSAVTSTVTFNVPSGQTVAYVGVAVAGVAAAADVRDSAAVTSQAFASQGTYQAVTTYTQT